MNKRELQLLMVAGITTALLLSNSELSGDEKADSDFMQLVAHTKGNIASRPLTEDDLLLELNEETAELYTSLSPEGQKLALKLASRGCNGMNDCKGQNACRTNDNSCAGRATCKGKTKCAFSDKNYAVKVAAKLMAEKRKELQSTSSPPP